MGFPKAKRPECPKCYYEIVDTGGFRCLNCKVEGTPYLGQDFIGPDGDMFRLHPGGEIFTTIQFPAGVFNHDGDSSVVIQVSVKTIFKKGALYKLAQKTVERYRKYTNWVLEKTKEFEAAKSSKNEGNSGAEEVVAPVVPAPGEEGGDPQLAVPEPPAPPAPAPPAPPAPAPPAPPAPPQVLTLIGGWFEVCSYGNKVPPRERAVLQGFRVGGEYVRFDRTKQMPAGVYVFSNGFVVTVVHGETIFKQLKSDADAFPAFRDAAAKFFGADPRLHALVMDGIFNPDFKRLCDSAEFLRGVLGENRGSVDSLVISALKDGSIPPELFGHEVFRLILEFAEDKPNLVLNACLKNIGALKSMDLFGAEVIQDAIARLCGGADGYDKVFFEAFELLFEHFPEKAKLTEKAVQNAIREYRSNKQTELLRAIYNRFADVLPADLVDKVRAALGKRRNVASS